MPELPEVETIVRTLTPHILNRRIKAVSLLHAPSLHPLSLPLESLTGAEISGIWRRAKLIMLDVKPSSQNGYFPTRVAIHLRMTGALLSSPFNSRPGKHTRCIFHLDCDKTGAQDLFFDDIRTFGKILAASEDILMRWPFWRKLGPEPLSLDEETLQRRLAGKKKLKSALLNQEVIAGIGNIYADEALFSAGISPLRESGALNGEECARLLAAIKDVLLRSISQCGSSIRDYRDADGNAGAFQNSFNVYGKGGGICCRCHGSLRKIKINGRSTVFCPQCQQ